MNGKLVTQCSKFLFSSPALIARNISLRTRRTSRELSPRRMILYQRETSDKSRNYYSRWHIFYYHNSFSSNMNSRSHSREPQLVEHSNGQSKVSRSESESMKWKHTHTHTQCVYIVTNICIDSARTYSRAYCIISTMPAYTTATSSSLPCSLWSQCLVPVVPVVAVGQNRHCTVAHSALKIHIKFTSVVTLENLIKYICIFAYID